MKTVIAQYKDLIRWDVKSVLYALRSNFPIEELGAHIYEHSEKENIFEQAEKEFPILGVTNKAGVYLNEYKKGSEINQPYKKVRSGELTYNPYRVNVGSIGIVQDEYDNFYISPAYVVFGTQKTLLNEYLYLILSSKWFNPFLRSATSGSVRQNLTYELLAQLKIPIPDIKTQQKIVADFHKAKAQAEKLQAQAKDKEAQIDEFLMRELGIKKRAFQKKEGVFAVQYKDLERWDVDYFVNSHTQYTSKNFVPLQTAIEKFCSTKILPKKNTEYFYVGMEHIEKNTGRYSYVSTNDNPVKSQSLALQKDCVYYAKLRPYLNKAFIFDKESDQFIATSELLGFFPKKEADHKFILSVLLSDVVLDQIKNLMVGARMPRISEKDFKNLQIVLPPLKTQKAIVAKIEKMRAEVQKLRSQSADILDTARERLQSAIVKN